MKYKDVLMLFLTMAFILSLAYSLGVDTSIWYIPVILLVVLSVTYYKLWIEK